MYVDEKMNRVASKDFLKNLYLQKVERWNDYPHVGSPEYTSAYQKRVCSTKLSFFFSSYPLCRTSRK